MKIEEIVELLRVQRERLDTAIEALEPVGSSMILPGRSGRISSLAPRRRMSAAARQRISAGMKARWAERKKHAKA